MDAALTLGQSSGEMCYAVEASTVFNIMSETFYSVEKEVHRIYLLINISFYKYFKFIFYVFTFRFELVLKM